MPPKRTATNTTSFIDQGTGPTPINAITSPSTGQTPDALAGASPGGLAPAAATPASVPGQTSPNSGTGAIQAILDLIGLGSAKGNDGQPLANSLLSAIDNSGLDPTNPGDSTSVQAFTDTWLPSQTAYQTRFPGIMQQLADGQNPTTPADYLSLEDTAKGLSTQYGIDYNTIFSPSVIANLVTGQVSGSELQTRMGTYLDAFESAPTQVQQAYQQFYGVNSATAFAAQIANPNVTDDQLKQMSEAASIQGAGSLLGLNVGQSRATQLGQMGVTYSTALNALHSVTAESGLYTQTVGEAQSSTGAGASTPVTANNQGISAAFGIDPTAELQVDQQKAERANAFKGGGGGAQTASVGDFGAGAANTE